ncbi:ATPase [Acidobacteria bacterium AB60]|nr:ATPase [Acidobacteria bacterium AB60]
MRLGDLLIRGNRVTEQEVARALELGRQNGGRLGDNLVAIGAIDQRTLMSFLHRIPGEPRDIAATGIDENELLALLMKLIYANRLETVRQFIDEIKLPYHVVAELTRMAVDRALLQTLGTRLSDNLLDMAYSLTEEGRRWTIDALERLRYAGPAPVTLADFCDQVNRQKLTNETITMKRIHQAIGDLEMDQSVLEQAGPALNSGRALLLYGPPGNGKTTVALRFASVFQDVIYIPYAIEVEGQIIRMFDASVHTAVDPAGIEDDSVSFVRQDEFDRRWVPCRRPFVIVGGELTLDMLDLRYDLSGHYYEAPMHVKALNGCFLIDDFGRQLVAPATLLNRWIVPLESRVDYMKLHTGKSFSIPFEELVIFSTNLEPEDLMDPAFLRRLPYKIEVSGPDVGRYRRILQGECARHNFELADEVFEYIVYRLTKEKGMELAAYQPRFIVDQVVATCRFLEQTPHFERRFIDYALDNLRVRKHPAGG